MSRGPKPVYQPRFSEEEVSQARMVASHHMEAHVRVQRAKMLLLLNGDPEMSTPEVARRVGVHEQTVRKWRRRWFKEGFSLDDRKGRGRKPTFSP